MLGLLGSSNALEKKVLIFGSASAQEEENFLENGEISIKNLALKYDQGDLGLGGKLQKNSVENEAEKSFCCSHTILLHVKTVDLITPAPSNPLKKLLLFPEIHSGFVDR